MVRTAITIISLLLSVLMPTQASAQKIEVTEAQKYYILYVKDIHLPDSVKIYGQPTFENDNEYYGGEEYNRFNDNYTNVNRSIKELTFGRDRNGIFFKIPAGADIDSVDITLVQAYDSGTRGGWRPKGAPEDNISVVWRLREPEPLNKDEHPKKQTDFIPAEDNGGEKATTALSSWLISNIDWVLLGLTIIVILALALALAALFGKSKPKEKPGNKAKSAEDPKFEIADLKKQIADLTTASNNCTKAISDLVRRYNTLESDMRKLQKKDRRGNTNNSSENIQAFRQMPPAQPVNLGGAGPVAGEKALAINSSGAGFFQLTRNIDGQVTFTLIDNPEVRNFFETNSSMLGIYKNDGIISYDNIPNNSHVYVESAGIAKEMGPGKYEVVAPLKLIFK